MQCNLQYKKCLTETQTGLILFIKAELKSTQTLCSRAKIRHIIKLIFLFLDRKVIFDSFCGKPSMFVSYLDVAYATA